MMSKRALDGAVRLSRDLVQELASRLDPVVKWRIARPAMPLRDLLLGLLIDLPPNSLFRVSRYGPIARPELRLERAKWDDGLS